ncbi:4-hydroxythreonine-4-phosphate dehydrogenase PdxA [Trichothermofontia sp.]
MYPALVLTLGDPAGIGPEVILKALAMVSPAQRAALTIVGNRCLLQRCYDQLLDSGLTQPDAIVHPQDLTILEVDLPPSILDQIQPGVGNAASGAASFAYLKTAIVRTLAGDFQGIVTAPIAKSAWQAAGHPYPGQTELLAELTQQPRYGMLFVARSPHTGWTLRTLLATTHIPLAQVPTHLTPDLMQAKLDLLVTYLQQEVGIPHPRIVIAGLNPHSGEQGQLGEEEQSWLIPWLTAAQARYTDVYLQGPVPPDTLWVKAGQAWYGTTSMAEVPDAYVALYHDQGLIPVKLMAFDRAVNMTIGLPLIRTSPDHGTAFDIVGRGMADATSFLAALEQAIAAAQRRYAEISRYDSPEHRRSRYR